MPRVPNRMPQVGRRLAVIVALATVFPSSPAGAAVPQPVSGGDEDAAIRAFVSIPPLAYLVDRVGGDRVVSTVLVEPGQSPHSYEPTPRRLAELALADVYFSVGLPFEERLLERLRDLGPDAIFVDASDGIERRPVEGHGHDGDRARHEPRGRLDPHVWMSPRNAARMAENVAGGLAMVDPGGRERYESNLDGLVADLDSLDADLSRELAPLRGGDLYVFHPAFGYFADAYGLRQVAVETGGREPGARALAELVASARRDGVRAIFVQPQFSTKSAEAIAAEIAAAVVPLDPLAYDYVSNLGAIARSVRAAIGPRRPDEMDTAAPDSAAAGGSAGSRSPDDEERKRP